MTRRRIDVWLAEHEFRAVDEAAERAGVETGAVARLAVIRAFHGVCRDVSEGRVRLRRRSGAAPVPSPTAPTVDGRTLESALRSGREIDVGRDHGNPKAASASSRASFPAEPLPTPSTVNPAGDTLIDGALPGREPTVDQRALFERLRRP